MLSTKFRVGYKALSPKSRSKSLTLNAACSLVSISLVSSSWIRLLINDS
jgi:hypothetical protein